jgi:hypothetical protein
LLGQGAGIKNRGGLELTKPSCDGDPTATHRRVVDVGLSKVDGASNPRHPRRLADRVDHAAVHFLEENQIRRWGEACEERSLTWALAHAIGDIPGDHTQLHPHSPGGPHDPSFEDDEVGAVEAAIGVAETDDTVASKKGAFGEWRSTDRALTQVGSSQTSRSSGKAFR